MSTAPSGGLSPALRDRVLERLGLSAPPPVDLLGLSLLYGRWCARVPFDNLQKMIALRSPGTRPLPGGDATDFLASWLSDGTGGTCWSSANALWALLCSVGFEARRVAGSMRDTGALSHGSVKVAVDGVDWLVDSSLLTIEPIEVGPRVTIHTDPILPVEVEPDGAEHIVWFDAPPGTQPIPCRLIVDDASDELFETRHEATRGMSPFNQRAYVRRHQPGRATVLVGNACVTRTSAGQQTRNLTPDWLCDFLRNEIGISGTLIDAWVATGSLMESFEPSSSPPPPPTTKVPPSRRTPAADVR